MKNFIFPQERELVILCTSEELRGVLFSPDHIKGLIFAVASAPEIPLPDIWLPWVFQRRGELSSEEQADKLTDLLMTMLQQQLGLMRDERVDLPASLILPEDYQERSAQDMALCQWFSGLLAGHSLLESLWQKAWQSRDKKHPHSMPDAVKTLSHCLSIFSTFADIGLAMEQSAQRTDKDNFASMLPKIYRSLPLALRQYVILSGELVEYLPNQFESYVQQQYES
ncbi:MAG: hypothetical protein ACI8R9_000965 [Paraglaciecola sp.]